ncbi:hypothetical protein JTE90_024113 [Oedothorax gibbosus]|uniref:Uncharacterized protein n=1 Tax=Oedothorax gibbosus TaxID=931172 RepID=A0AAV6UQX8_9ARAC|nr:hypothetical protein JTE90_024113 [Oedothorax gibbosus]
MGQEKDHLPQQDLEGCGNPMPELLGPFTCCLVSRSAVDSSPVGRGIGSTYYRYKIRNNILWRKESFANSTKLLAVKTFSV